MPAFSRNLKQTLDRALASARERRHEYATLEHLLLSLIEDSDASAVLRACSVDLDVLGRNLRDYLDRELDNLVNEDAEEVGLSEYLYDRPGELGIAVIFRSHRPDFLFGNLAG
jgi:ATP-dependent Clp protease ATP-binding subunit ClpA